MDDITSEKYTHFWGLRGGDKKKSCGKHEKKGKDNTCYSKIYHHFSSIFFGC